MDKAEIILTSIYEGIMYRGAIEANTAKEWADDAVDYFMEGFVSFEDIKYVTIWLRHKHNATESYPAEFIGEWLNEKHNNEMVKKLTWLELARAILELPDEELTRPAAVWMFADTSKYEGEHFVYGIHPFDSNTPIGNDNHSSIDIG